MTVVLVTSYNQLLKEAFYPKRWLSLVETTLKKAKAQSQEIEESCTNGRADKMEMIETDGRFLKARHSSRKKYEIESAILQKRIIFDNSLNEMRESFCMFTDLQSYCDR